MEQNLINHKSGICAKNTIENIPDEIMESLFSIATAEEPVDQIRVYEDRVSINMACGPDYRVVPEDVPENIRPFLVKEKHWLEFEFPLDQKLDFKGIMSFIAINLYGEEVYLHFDARCDIFKEDDDAYIEEMADKEIVEHIFGEFLTDFDWRAWDENDVLVAVNEKFFK